MGEDGIVKDAICGEFSKLLRKMGIKRDRVNFYALRHTFRTIADRMRDRPAVDRIMGHTDGSQAEAYREYIEADRLQDVANHVRAWLFPPKKKTVKPR
jgi:integrase